MADFHLSVLARAAGAGPDDSPFQELLATALHETGQAERWTVADGGQLWCSAQPDDAAQPTQGWKLHLSATPASAATVLARALPVLLTGNSGFKFARTPELVAHLNGRHTPRGHSGKFVTVYPFDDDEAVRLAEALHEATAGLPGPRILSDRQYAPGSLVHYRYGAFVEERRISNDGMYAWVIFDPDGNPVEDRRVGQYVPPAWARCPFPQPAPSGTVAPSGPAPSGPAPSGAVAVAPSGTSAPVAGDAPSAGAQGVLIGGRFLVREAIRHANKGGVYRAIDRQTGAPAILKEARAHVAVDEAGRDVRDLLRAEARALEAIGEAAAPRLLALFEQEDHVFLAEDLVPGRSLREWVLDRIREGGWRRSIPDALATAERLTALLDGAHRAGLVLRDFTPNNIMIRPDGELRLIDLELAVRSDDPGAQFGGSGTPGYSAPEQMRGAPAAVEADHYSLGACICFLLTGSTPDLLAEDPPSRPMRDRLAEWLAVRHTSDLPDAVPELVLDLMDDDPARRATTADAARVLATALAAGGTAAPAVAHPAPSVTEDLHGGLDDVERQDAVDDAVDGIVGYLLDTMTPDDPERLWPVSCTRGSPDPCIVQLGAAGVLGPLTRYFELTRDPRLPEVIATAGEWLGRRVGADPQRPPGLYFGRAGVAWALYRAGRAIGDDALRRQGLELAAALPASSPNPDITHGTAGIGFALLYLGRDAGREDLLRRADESADVLVTSVDRESGSLLWSTPAAFESRLAGGRYHGFAHGTAGVAAFLLATGRADALEIAVQAGESLLGAATVTHGLAQWGPGPGDDTTAPYWCHGAAGIGSFLTRLHRVTGDDRFDKVAGMAAKAVMENSWRGVLGQCHGLAGNGEFLLDLAGTASGTGDERAAQHLASAAELARIVLASRTVRSGHVVFPDEEGTVSPTWAEGVAGILSFLVRLRYRSSRLWTVEPAGGDLG